MSPLPPFLRAQRTRVLVGSVLGLVVAGVAIGLLIALVSTKALEAAGLDTDQTASPATTTDRGDPGTQPTAETPAQTPAQTSASPTTPPSSATTDAPNPTLTASPDQVATFGEITLSGRFPGLAPGTPLQIERRVGAAAWELFPVSLSSDAGGTFSTFVQTGQPGENQFKVSVPSTMLSTPVVTVTVG